MRHSIAERDNVHQHKGLQLAMIACEDLFRIRILSPRNSITATGICQLIFIHIAPFALMKR